MSPVETYFRDLSEIRSTQAGFVKDNVVAGMNDRHCALNQGGFT